MSIETDDTHKGTHREKCLVTYTHKHTIQTFRLTHEESKLSSVATQTHSCGHRRGEMRMSSISTGCRSSSFTWVILTTNRPCY